MKCVGGCGLLACKQRANFRVFRVNGEKCVCEKHAGDKVSRAF